MNIKISGLVNDSIVDGPGFRYTLFVQGCPHNCKGCHNPQTHDFSGGTVTTSEEILKKILDNPLLSGVTFSGGEPFCQAEALSELGRKIKQNGLNIITYTGYTFEYLIKNSNSDNYYKELILISDYIIDGRFEQDMQTYDLKFRGSSNQRIIDCKKSLDKGFAVTAEL